MARTRVKHAWLAHYAFDEKRVGTVLSRLKNDALDVDGDYFFFAQDRIDQGIFTGTRPVALYCGNQTLKVVTWREVFIKAVDVLTERDADSLRSVAKDFGNPPVAIPLCAIGDITVQVVSLN